MSDRDASDRHNKHASLDTPTSPNAQAEVRQHWQTQTAHSAIVSPQGADATAALNNNFSITGIEKKTDKRKTDAPSETNISHDPATIAKASDSTEKNADATATPPAAISQQNLARVENAPATNASELNKQAERSSGATAIPTPEKPVVAKSAESQPAQIIESPKPVPAEASKPQQAANAVKPAPVAEAPKPKPVAEAPKPQPAAEAPKPAVAAEASRPQPVVQQSTPHAAEPKVQLVTEVPKTPSQAVHVATAEAMKPAAQATVQTAPKLEGTITHDAAPKSNDRSIAANKSAEHATLSSSKLSGQSASTRDGRQRHVDTQ
jgi:hypothetical protein